MSSPAPLGTLSALELAAWLADDSRPRPLLLDVREPWEFATCRIDGSTSLPMQELVARIDEIDIEGPIVCICHHGARSMQVAAFLHARGATDVRNLTGGVAAWAHHVDPTFPTY
jgi:rhodanese-related sulfurtransferase